MTSPGSEDQDNAVRSRGAEIAHRLFDHLGISKRERTKKLEELMGWTYHPAHRRLSGDIPWSIDELERLTTLCGMSLADVLQLEESESADGEVATFLMGGTRIPCRAWVKGPLNSKRPTVLAAVRDGTQWVVTSAADAAPAIAHEVVQVLLQPEPPGQRFRIAVLDDNPEVTDSLCAYLRLVNFEAQPYTTLEDLSTAIRTQPFDGYVLDWLIGPTTAAGTIAEIRAADPDCPIVVLTGKIREGQADQDHVAMIVTLYRAMFFEKPAATAIIAAKLKQALDSVAAARPR